MRRFILLSALSDASELKRRFDGAGCLVCSSHSEGMPTVVFEATARGLATVATDVGATAELVDSGNGILSARPQSRAVAEAMSRVPSMNDPALRDLKSRSLDRVRAYGWGEVAHRVLRSAEQVASKRVIVAESVR